jgi:Ni2+-binding GTPase involved in maturation of urease and hydrogenase
MDRAEEECRSLNPGVEAIRLSALSGTGVAELVEWLERRRLERFGRPPGQA